MHIDVIVRNADPYLRHGARQGRRVEDFNRGAWICSAQCTLYSEDGGLIRSITLPVRLYIKQILEREYCLASQDGLCGSVSNHT